ncbi:MAG: SusC/RagA family TonB-linked outer membrane protein [Salibacteraceae bacterium]|nr:SusC/RagA family TonB-linked outer membrane protein [Salibacteraceae bacterium]MDP4763864.1 SusC/RagA family TonB-linked outer membrane protein [Salibacteraceae bacterium]
MKLRTTLLCAVMMLFSHLLLAQERTVTGTVRSDDGSTLPGVTVQIKGTTSGTASDMDGKYSIAVPGGDAVIVYSFIGMDTKEVAVGAQATIDVTLGMGVQLEEVVVTALGISRDKKSLGYSTQTVSGDDVSKVKDVNFMSSLSGQVAGAQIKNSGTMGGSANVIIRGYKSIGGNNQPLYVVDGIPISNDITNTTDQTTGRGGYDYGNAAMDINPDDIESVSVLKGAAATALYGARAANGVVLIITKKGNKKKKGLGVTVSTGAIAGQINKNTMPTYQKQYGAGYGRFYGPDTAYDGTVSNGYLYEADVDGDGNPDGLSIPMEEDASYGLAFDPNLSVYNWKSVYPELTDTYKKTQPYVAAENDATTFYETSLMLNNSASVEGANDNGSFRLGITDMWQKGVLPNSNMRRNNASLNVNYNLSDKLNVSSSMQFIQNGATGRYGTGYDSRNVNQSFRQWYQVSTDMMDQKSVYEDFHKNISWNPYGFVYSEDIWEQAHYFDNYYWTRYENYSTDSRNRFIGNVVANYELTDWLSVMGRITNDSYDEIREERIAVGSVDPSSYYKYTRSFTERNYDLILSFDKKFGTDNKIDFNGNLGTNLRRSHVSSISAETNGGLVVPGVYSLSNSVNSIEAPIETDARRAVDGYFARASIGYDRFLFVDVTGRYDVSSTLPANDNAFFYPAATVSFVYSELFDASFMDFGKLRFNYAEVGNDAPTQRLQNVYSLGTPFGGNTLASAPNTGFNANLLPENTRSLELGFENKFFKDRLGADLTFYRSNTFNQILAVRPSTASGTYFQYVNAGDIQNQGIELQLYGNIVKKGDFRWDARLNWAMNRNKVISLTDDLTTYQLASVQGGITIEATVGEPYGVIKGSNFVYHEGEPIVYENSAGAGGGMRYAKTATPEIIGNMLPDWTGGITNTFKYKNISGSFLIDVQKGGNFFSLDTWYGYATGIYANTAGTNDKGNNIRDAIEDGGGYNIGGVVAAKDADGNYVYDADGNLTSDGTANTEYAGMVNYANAIGYARAPNAAHVYDATYVKLRQVSLTYSLTPSVLAKTPFQGVDFSLVGRNLAILYKNSPYTDPEAGLSAGNIQGYQSGAYPSVRELGVNITVKF